MALADTRNAMAVRLQDPNFTSVSSALVDQLINTSISYYQNRPYWFNESVANVILTVGSNVVTLPSDFLSEIEPGGLVIAYSNAFYALDKIPSASFDWLNLNGPGMPSAYTYRDGGIELYSYPDQPYALVIRYLKSYATLVADTDTNDFLKNANMMIMYDAMSRYYAEYKQDSTMESYYTSRSTDEETNLKKRSGRLTGTGRLTLYAQC